MADTTNWFTSMFSGDAAEGDAIAGRTLNITKITGLLVPIGTGIVALLNEIAGNNGPFHGITLWQKVAIALAVVTFVAFVVVADVLARAYATGKLMQANGAGQVAIFKNPLPVAVVKDGRDSKGKVVAARSGANGNAAFLVSVDDAVVWLSAPEVDAP